MKATGIVRRIDDLGRVVIPKEIRRTQRLREGTPLEIYTDHEGEIILKKYSPMAELGVFAKQYADAMAQTLGQGVCITDRDTIVAVAGSPKREMIGQPVSKPLEKMIIAREYTGMQGTEKKMIPLYQGDEESYTEQIVFPILSEGDVIGAVVIFSKENRAHFGETQLKAAACAAAFLGRQMES